MLKITNGSNEFKIGDKKLIKKNNEILIKPKYEYWYSELAFILDENKKISKIVHRLDGDGDTLTEYINQSNNVKNFILLKSEDYVKVLNYYNNLYGKIDYQKEAIIESSAVKLSYYCYQYFVLEQQPVREHDLEWIFKDLSICSRKYYKYEKEIYARAKELLKEKYKMDDIKFIFKFEGGK